MTEASIVARDVSFQVRGTPLVSGVDLDVSPGELVAIIGPNGAGKSTLLGLLSGNLQPSAGEVLLKGVDPASSTPGELALVRAMLTQREPFELAQTAAQVVSMGRFPHRREPGNTTERDRRIVEETMRVTDTRQFSDRVYATLSRGEQIRVSLARVLAQATPVVFLDEPTTALDVAHSERIMSEAVRQARSGLTVVLALHDLNAAAVHADRIVVMSHGSVVADGAPRAVLEADLLSSVYSQQLSVVEHPFKDCPLVLIAG